MTPCNAITLSNNQCKNSASKNCKTCWIHTKNECGICLNESNKCNIYLDCGHKFCEKCINIWIIEKDKLASCPMCRTLLSPERINTANRWGLKNGLLYNAEIYYYPVKKLDLIDETVLRLFFNATRNLCLTDSQFQRLVQGLDKTPSTNICYESFKSVIDIKYKAWHTIKTDSFPDNPINFHVFLF
jgi:hypothetical protein